MSKKLKVVLNSAGVRQFLKSQEMASICREVADGQASKLGPSFKTDTFVGKSRVNASVYTEDPAAIQDNLKNNGVLKSNEVSRRGKVVQGYYRTTKSGEKIYVKGYQRRK